MIREKLFDNRGNLRPGWEKSNQSSVVANTWMGEKEVIQCRPQEQFLNWKSIMNLLKSIEDHQGLLSASECATELDEERNCFWVLYLRQDLPDSPALLDYKNLTFSKWLEVIDSIFPTLYQTEELLREQTNSLSEQEALDLIKNRAGKSSVVRITGTKQLREYMHFLGYSTAVPDLPEAEMVLTHNDLIPRNVINTDNGYRLIDWELTGLAPSYETWTHWLTWIMIYLPESYSQQLFVSFYQQLKPQLHLEENEFQHAIYWQMIREGMFWKREEFSFYLERANRFVNL